MDNSITFCDICKKLGPVVVYYIGCERLSCQQCAGRQCKNCGPSKRCQPARVRHVSEILSDPVEEISNAFDELVAKSNRTKKRYKRAIHHQRRLTQLYHRKIQEVCAASRQIDSKLEKIGNAQSTAEKVNSQLRLVELKFQKYKAAMSQVKGKIGEFDRIIKTDILEIKQYKSHLDGYRRLIEKSKMSETLRQEREKLRKTSGYHHRVSPRQSPRHSPRPSRRTPRTSPRLSRRTPRTTPRSSNHDLNFMSPPRRSRPRSLTPSGEYLSPVTPQIPRGKRKSIKQELFS